MRAGAADGVAASGSSFGDAASAAAILPTGARAVQVGKQRFSGSSPMTPPRGRQRAPLRISSLHASGKRRPRPPRRPPRRKALGPRCTRLILLRRCGPRVVGAGLRAGRALRRATRCATHRSGSRAVARPSAARAAGAIFACLGGGVPRQALPLAPAAFAVTRRSFGAERAVVLSSPARCTTASFPRSRCSVRPASLLNA